MACDRCKIKGKSVPLETVKALIKASENLAGNAYDACMDLECDVIYYSTEQVFTSSQVTVAPWYKNFVEDKVLCYCHNVSQEDLDRLMREYPEEGYEALMDRFKGIHDSDCLHKNPLGKCCHGTIKKYVEDSRN